jgi:RNA polymerase sigma-70 factor (ECF subfamily)
VNEPEEARLLEAARAGDAGALDALLTRYQPRIYRFGMKMCRRPEDAADVLQDTLLAMARGLRDFRGASSVSTWLYKIARSYCIKKRRRSKFAPERELSLEAEARDEVGGLADPRRRPDETLEARRLEEALARSIASLDPKYRDVLVLRDVEGLPAGEVAQVMGLTVEAVKSRLHRARASVREHVAPLLGLSLPSQPGARGPCPDIVRLFSRHLEGDLSSNICAEMEKHLEACGFCQASCESLKKTLALCRLSPAPEVPAALQAKIRAGIRGFLDERR